MTTLVRLQKFAFPDEEFDSDVRRTYIALRMWMGAIGFGLPIILVSWGFAHEIRWDQMTSLSAFYWLHEPADGNPLLRDWFVGSLSAIAISLIIYKGYGRLENWLLNLAGFAISVVALKPMPWPPTQGGGVTLSVHGTAAVIFFSLISAAVWFCAGNTLHSGVDPRVRMRWLRIYKIFASGIIAAPLVAWLIAKDGQWTIWVEALGVWLFSGYWFAKTYELLKVSEVEPSGKPAPKLKWVGGQLHLGNG